MGKFKEWLTADFKNPVTEVKEAYKKGKDQYDKDKVKLEKRLVVVKELRRTTHFTHFLLTICTGGLWSIVWLWRALSNTQYNRQIEHDLRVIQHELMFNQVNKGKDDDQ